MPTPYHSSPTSFPLPPHLRPPCKCNALPMNRRHSILSAPICSGHLIKDANDEMGWIPTSISLPLSPPHSFLFKKVSKNIFLIVSDLKGRCQEPKKTEGVVSSSAKQARNIAGAYSHIRRLDSLLGREGGRGRLAKRRRLCVCDCKCSCWLPKHLLGRLVTADGRSSHVHMPQVGKNTN